MNELYDKEAELRFRLVSPGMEPYWRKIFSYRLAMALSKDDIDGLVSKNIYFNLTFFPCSTTIVRETINHNDTLINLDYDSLLDLSEDQRIASLLHELGHAFNPKEPNETKEFVADNYAVEREYGEFLISSLERHIKIHPKSYDTDLSRERIKKIRKNLELL